MTAWHSFEIQFRFELIHLHYTTPQSTIPHTRIGRKAFIITNWYDDKVRRISHFFFCYELKKKNSSNGLKIIKWTLSTPQWTGNAGYLRLKLTIIIIIFTINSIFDSNFISINFRHFTYAFLILSNGRTWGPHDVMWCDMSWLMRVYEFLIAFIWLPWIHFQFFIVSISILKISERKNWTVNGKNWILQHESWWWIQIVLV